jgi:NADP-dependent 3-hydroxy acid dehydrogenase YdfG
MMGAPYFAAFNMTHAFMPELLRRRKGLIIHVNSPACRLVWPGATGYAAARWALRGLHEALCQDLAGTGVRSAHVLLGKVNSDYFAANPGSEEHLPGAAKIIPVLTPEECARVIMDIVHRPRREVVYPFMLRMFCWADAVMPSLVRWLGAQTGRRHAL